MLIDHKYIVGVTAASDAGGVTSRRAILEETMVEVNGQELFGLYVIWDLELWVREVDVGETSCLHLTLDIYHFQVELDTF